MARHQFHFRPLAERDLPLLSEWLNRPHVAEWWDDGPVSCSAVREKYLPRIVGPTSVSPNFAILNGTPVGFIQSYVAAEQGNGWWPDESDPGVIGIDQFLADAESLGKGLGTEMVSQFALALFGDRSVTRIQVDPEPTNLRAIRCYEKVGFRKQSVIETPDGLALLMTMDRPAV